MIKVAAVAIVLALALVAPAWAQGDIEGIVERIDRGSNTVHLRDGRIVHIKPGSTIMLDGRSVTFGDLEPGVRLVVRAGAAQAPAAQAPAAQTPAMMPDHPTVDASGVVARVDRASNTIVFEDGRTLEVAGSRVWRPVELDAVQPGQTVFLDDARPVAFSPPVQGGARHQRLGTIGRIDGTRQMVLLTDGTIVRVSPTAKLSKQGRTVDLSKMQPGDEVVIWLAPRATAGDASRTQAEENAGSASPAADGYPAASIESDEILVVRPHVQAP